MSDRKVVMECENLTLYMDGETGTWRLFSGESENIDLTLNELSALVQRLPSVIELAIEKPEEFDAYWRKRNLTHR